MALANYGSSFSPDVKVIQRITNLVGNLPLYWRVFGIKGMMTWALIRYGASDKMRPQYLRNIDYPVYLRANTTDPLTLREIFLDRDYDIDNMENIEFIVDAGANIGLASIFFANQYPGAKILAIEPEKSNFDVLKRNVSNYPRVVPINAALWNHSGHIKLVDPGRGAHGFITTETPVSPECPTESTPSVTLEDLMSAYSIPRIDLLKVDIEGAEKEVFESSDPWINRVSTIIIELHERFKPGCEEAFFAGSYGMDTILERGKLIVRHRAI